jgi:tetratricopeptide (TPR) repeat protein
VPVACLALAALLGCQTPTAPVEPAPPSAAAQTAADGGALAESGDLAAARREYEQAIGLEPEQSASRLALARVCLALGDFECAIREGRAAAGADELAARVVVAEALVRQQRPDEALQELAAVPVAERSAEVWLAIGRTHVVRGDRVAAGRALLEAHARAPNDPEILEALLEIDRARGRSEIERSRLRIERAAAADPENGALVRLHGLVLMLLGRKDESRERLERAIALDPSDVAAYQTLAYLLVSQGSLEEALGTYERAASERPEDGTVHVVLGSLHEIGGRRAEAIAEYERAIAIDPALAIAKNNIAFLLAEEKSDLDRALALARAAKAELPQSPNAADTLGFVLLRRGAADEAIPVLREAQAGLEPGNPGRSWVDLHLAEALVESGESEEARTLLEQMLARREASPLRRSMTPPWAVAARALLAKLEP